MHASGWTLVTHTTNCSIHRKSLTVWNGCLGPHLVCAQLEVVGKGGDPVLVGVHPLDHQPALADVGVHVPAEQRDSEHHWQSPGNHGLKGGFPGFKPHTRTLWPNRSHALTRSMPPTARSTIDSPTPTPSVRIQMKRGRRRSSETGASQPTPSEPTTRNMEPMKPAISGDLALSTSPVAASCVGAIFPAFEAAGTGTVMWFASNRLPGMFRDEVSSLKGRLQREKVTAMSKKSYHRSTWISLNDRLGACLLLMNASSGSTAK